MSRTIVATLIAVLLPACAAKPNARPWPEEPESSQRRGESRMKEGSLHWFPQALYPDPEPSASWTPRR